MSTTDSSDWEVSGSGIRSRSEPPLPGPEPPSVPELTGDGELESEATAAIAAAPPANGPLSPPVAEDGTHHGFIRTLASAGILSSKAAATTRPGFFGAGNFSPSSSVFPSSSSSTAAAPRAHSISFGSSLSRIDRENHDRTPGQEDLTLSHMIAHQEQVYATPSQIAFLAQVSGRGSRGEMRGFRGRGRVARGGPPPKIKIEPPPPPPPPVVQPPPHDDGASATAPPRKVNRGGRPRGSRAGQSSSSSSRPVNRGGRPRGSRAGMSASTGRGALGGGRGGAGGGMKRKRISSGGGIEGRHDDRDGHGDEDEDDEYSDTSEEITSLPTQSRSGRRITQVVTPIPLGTPEQLEPSSLKPLKPPSFYAPTSSDLASSGQKPAKRKRVTLSAVCKNCGRGHSPQSNQIVFCDGCNTPWHQYCHDRPITPSVILEEEKEWHCGDCEVQAEEAGYMVGRIPPAEGMGLAEKRRALEAMDRAELVALLLRASSLYPDLPILKPPPPPETWNAAISAITLLQQQQVQAPIAKGADSTADYEYYDEPLPYPRAGNGVLLPPEKEEDAGLLIDEDVNTYSHSWVKGESWVGGRLADLTTDSTDFAPAHFAIEIGA